MATKKMAPTRPSKYTINALSLVATGEYGEELLEASKRIEESRQRDSGRVKSPKSSADKKLKELRAALRVVLARLDELLSLDGQPLLPRSFQVARFIHQAAILAETGPRRGAPKKPTTDNANKRSTAGRPITITTKELQQLRDDLAQTISEHAGQDHQKLNFSE